MKYIFQIISLVLTQVFIMRHIHIFGVATPLLYVYLVVLFSRDMRHWQRLLMAFVTGTIIDTFSNTPGLAAASATLAAFVQPYILELYLRKEDEPDYRPSIATMGFFRYFSYALLVVCVFCFSFFSLEFLSFHYWLECLEGCFGSMAITLFLILIIDSIRK